MDKQKVDKGQNRNTEQNISKDLMRVEFGHELGDPNSAKIYDIFAGNKKKEDSKEEKKD